MTQLLVSVRSAEEAAQALLGGAAWIDVKEPQRGSLGAPTLQQVELVRDCVGGQVNLSVALGELNDVPSQKLIPHLNGFSFAKVGLSKCDTDSSWRQRWIALMSELPPGVSPVAVAYADHVAAGAPSPRSVIEFARQQACRMFLCDTFGKSRGNLFHYFSDEEIVDLIGMAREANLMVALAGSLTCDVVPRAIACAPDIVAVRGAACRGGRDGHVDARLVRQLVSQLSTPRASRRENSSIHILDGMHKHF